MRNLAAVISRTKTYVFPNRFDRRFQHSSQLTSFALSVVGILQIYSKPWEPKILFWNVYYTSNMGETIFEVTYLGLLAVAASLLTQIAFWSWERKCTCFSKYLFYSIATFFPFALLFNL